MKRSLWLTIALLAVLTIFAACKKEENNTTETAAVTETATSASTTDTSGTVTSTMPATDTTMTSTGATSTAGASAMNDADKKFVMMAAQGGMAEVQFGTDASRKATNADVKAFGQKMADDHSKANQELTSLASSKGLTLPTDIGDKHKKAQTKLASLSGAKYDKEYMDMMVADHKEDVAEFKKAAKDSKDADLKAWAAKTLPTLEGHLKMAEDTQKKVK